MLDRFLWLVYHSVVVLAIVVGVVFTVAFLGGLSSAAWEARREKRQGLAVSRPAWENRRKRRAAGVSGTFRANLALLTHRGHDKPCWCGCGPLVRVPGFGIEPDTLGCAAWEAGDVTAIARHDMAGGYMRTEVA